MSARSVYRPSFGAANSIDRSNTLHKTYAPLDIEAVRNADEARFKGTPADPRRERNGDKSCNSTARKSCN
jgi:hypothetical protein